MNDGGSTSLSRHFQPKHCCAVYCFSMTQARDALSATRLRLLFQTNRRRYTQLLPVLDSAKVELHIDLPCTVHISAHCTVISYYYSLTSSRHVHLTIDLLMLLKAYTSGHSLFLTSLKHGGYLLFLL